MYVHMTIVAALEVRVIVEDSENTLRLDQPVTVRLTVGSAP
jgi:hypothetical protein